MFLILFQFAVPPKSSQHAITLLTITLAQNYSFVTLWLYALRGKAAKTLGPSFLFPLFSLLRYFLDDNKRFDKLAHAQTKYLGYRKTQKLEPVSSTSRRGARAAYHDEYPRDFGPRIAYTVS